MEVVVTVNGHRLDVGQSTALWVALDYFRGRLAEGNETREEAGAKLSDGYMKRLTEVQVLWQGAAQSERLAYTELLTRFGVHYASRRLSFSRDVGLDGEHVAVDAGDQTLVFDAKTGSYVGGYFGEGTRIFKRRPMVGA